MIAKAMNQTQLKVQAGDVQHQSAALQQQITELATKQATLQRSLLRFDVQRELVQERNIPDYAPWLPFSNK